MEFELEPEQRGFAKGVLVTVALGTAYWLGARSRPAEAIPSAMWTLPPTQHLPPVPISRRVLPISSPPRSVTANRVL